MDFVSTVNVPSSNPPFPKPSSAYRTRLAQSREDLILAQKLRFEVFNVELREGLRESWDSGLDSDRFDTVCDHLLVEHIPTSSIVGTYRLQTGIMAAENIGYYSAQEFNFTPYEPFRSEIVELGRACVHAEHRKMSVINMLWRGIGEYANARKSRYLLGCSSLTSQDPALGNSTYEQLKSFLAPAEFQTMPLPAFRCAETPLLQECPAPPRLLRAYLSVGAKICSPPALDREFGTIDFLTLVDLRTLPTAVVNYFNI